MDPKDMMIFKPRLPRLVCSIENGIGDGANGGGDGAPTFNLEQFQSEMKDFVIKAVNGAISTHLSRSLDNRFEENNKSLLGQLEKMIGNQPAPAASSSETGNVDIDTAIKNATAPLLKQLEEQRAANERAAAQAKAERENRMRQEETGALQSALTSAGVPGPLAQAAVNLLHPHLERDSEGNIVFVSKETGPTGSYDERVSISEGVGRYLKTEDGKHFLPARQVTGSGNRGGAAPGTTPGQETDHEFVGNMLGILGIG